MMDGQGRRSKPQGISEFIFREIHAAFHDIRQKAIEEGWFGRVVTPAPVVEVGHETPERRASFEELWAAREIPRDAHHEHEHDVGIER